MKKKLLILALMIVAIISVLAISVSAEEYFGDVEIIDLDSDGNSDIAIGDMVHTVIAENNAEGVPASSESRVKISCNCEAGSHTFPAYYITSLKSTGRRFYSFSYEKINSILTSYCESAPTISGSSILAYEMPNGYTAIWSGFFYESRTTADGKIEYFMAGSNIEYFSFANCTTMTSLEGTAGGKNWFQSAASLKEVDLGKYITNIPVMLFYNCTALENVNIPAESQITTISGSAFYNCYSLDSLHIPSTVTSLGDNAFQKCSSISFDNDFKNVKTFGSRCFSACSITALDLTSATSVGEAAFEACKSLTSVRFENNTTLTSLPHYTFGGSNAFTEITIPDCMKTIGTQAFYSCTSLKTVNISKNSNITAINGAAFSGCTSLEAFYIPKGVTSLGESGTGNSPFNGCTKLYFVSEPGEEKPEVYYFPTTVKSLVGEIFKGCASLNDVIVFHKDITAIDNGWAFCNAKAISIVFLGDMTNISTTGNAWTGGMKIYLCNENDLSSADISTQYSSSAFVYCNAEGNEKHLYKVDKDATCTEMGGDDFACFCGELNPEVTPTPALGHIKGEFITIDYENGFFQNGYIYYKCEREGCVEAECYTVKTDSEYIFPALFVANGYSVSVTGSMTQGFAVNREAFDEYTDKVEKITFGMVAAVKDTRLGTENGVLFTAPGTKAHDKVAVVDFTEKEYSIIQLVVNGLADYADTEVFCCMYYTQGGSVYYANEGVVATTATAQSYNQAYPIEAIIPGDDE